MTEYTLDFKDVKVISFDLDDTIFACRPVLTAAESAFTNFLEQNHPEIASKFPDKATWKYKVNQGRDEFPDKAHDYTFLRKYVVKTAAEELSLENPEHISESAFKAFISARNDVEDHIYPGVIETLLYLKKRYVLVSFTNGNASVSEIPLLDEIFHHSLTAVQVGAPKPHPHGFDRIIHLTGVKPHEIVHVGDSKDCDVLGAKQAGIHAIWVNKTEIDHPCENAKLTVRCVSELKQHVG